MIPIYRIDLCWPGRVEDLDAMARRTFAMLASLAGIHPRLGRFSVEARPRTLALVTEADCRAALERGVVAWQLGRRRERSHEVRLFVDRPVAPEVEVVITCGVPPLPLPGIFAPNRLVARIRPGSEVADARVVQAVLVAAALAWEADFGHAGTETCPTPAAALDSPGVPPVGWMTFLGRRFPALPTSWPSPALAYGVGSIGTLVVAHPDAFREHHREHREAMARVESALRDGGVLVPAPQLAR